LDRLVSAIFTNSFVNEPDVYYLLLRASAPHLTDTLGHK
jgi:hypothetical protein